MDGNVGLLLSIRGDGNRQIYILENVHNDIELTTLRNLFRDIYRERGKLA